MGKGFGKIESIIGVQWGQKNPNPRAHRSSGKRFFFSYTTTVRYSTDVAHSIGVQNVILPFFCLQEPIYNVLVIFFILKLGVYVYLVKSLLILSFYLSKQLKESSRTQNLEVKRL